MSNYDDVEKIMEKIKNQIKEEQNVSNQVTIANIVEVAAGRVKERMQEIKNKNSLESKHLEYINSLNLEKTGNLVSLANDEILENELRNANLSVSIQLYNKIDTSKPHFVRGLILKIRNLLQNEVRFSLNPIVNNQTRFNTHTVRALNELNSNRKKIENQISTIKSNHDQLSSEIKSNHDQLSSEIKSNHDQLSSEIKSNHDQLKNQFLQNNELWNRLISLEISRGYNELLKREPTDAEINEYHTRISSGEIVLDNFRDILKRSKEYHNVLENNQLQELILMKKLNEKREYSQEMVIQKNKKNPNAIFYVNFENIIRAHENPFVERHVEYLWVLKNLPVEGTILDIGCADSELANELIKIKTLRVFGADIRTPDTKILFQFRKEDATRLSFEDGSFDVITIISSIEHFGLEVYGSKQIDGADKLAMNEIKRVMKPNGLLLLTVPFGKKPKSWSRVYDVKSLQSLIEDFEVLEEKFYVQEDFGWVETSKEIAESSEGAKYGGDEISSGAIACIMARRRKNDGIH